MDNVRGWTRRLTITLSTSQRPSQVHCRKCVKRFMTARHYCSHTDTFPQSTLVSTSQRPSQVHCRKCVNRFMSAHHYCSHTDTFPQSTLVSTSQRPSQVHCRKCVDRFTTAHHYCSHTDTFRSTKFLDSYILWKSSSNHKLSGSNDIMQQQWQR